MSAPRGIRPSLKSNVDEALRLFAMEAEWVGLNVDETEYVLEEALKCYGSMADASQIRTLFAFYRRYLGMADVARRQALLTRITEFVSEGRQNRYLALLFVHGVLHIDRLQGLQGPAEQGAAWLASTVPLRFRPR